MVSTASAQTLQSTMPAPTPEFQSHGISVKVTQASVSKTVDTLTITAVIENHNDYDLLAALVSKDPIAIDNRGNSFQSQNFVGVNGLSTCAPGTGTFPSDVKTCLDPDNQRGLPLEAYTTLSAGAAVPLVMILGFHGGDRRTIGDAISFSAVMAVRKAPSEAELAKRDKPALAPATIITIGVSLAPLIKG